MSENFTLKFNNGEEELLARGKAAYGNTLGRVLKNALREKLDAGTASPEEHQQERSPDLAESVYRLNFADVNDREFISEVWGGDEKAAAQAVINRLSKVLATNQALYPEIEKLFVQKNPRLSRLAGITTRV